MISLHRWLPLAVAALLICQSPATALSGPSRGSTDSTAPPDILLIMPDQMRGDCLSCLGHPAVHTPNFDQIAREGTLFRRAYSTVPSCIPARYALMTGWSPQHSGVVGFKQKPIKVPTLPQLMRRAGYVTALVGREMHQLANATELGYQRAVLGSTYVSDDDYARELREAYPETKNLRKWVTDQGLTYNHWQAKPWPLPDRWHPTTWIIRKARELVAEVPSEQRLFLTASFYAPHSPLFPPAAYFDACLQRDLPSPAHGDWVDWTKLTTRGTNGGHRVLLEGEVLRRAQAGYFGLIEQLDNEIAPLIAQFKARSERAGRPWLVVVTADHGEMLGDHGYFRKCEPLEGSANIPLLIAGSADLGLRGGQRCLSPTCLEDLLPTLTQLAGVPCPPVDGQSLVPVLRGETQQVRSWLHFEHAPCYSQQQAFQALTDGHIKYIWRPHDGAELLFDLNTDPREEHDLSADAGHHELLITWRSRLIEQLAPRSEGFSDGHHLISGRRYLPLNAGVPNSP